MRAGLSGRRIALGAASAMMTAGLVGVPAYVSSVANAALAIQLDESCLTDLGVRLPAENDRVVDRLDAEVASVAGTRRPVVSDMADFTFSVVGVDDGVVRRMVMLERLGQFEALGVDVPVPGPGEVLVPEWATRSGAVLRADSSLLAVPFLRGRRAGGIDMTPIPLRVVGTYPTISTRPEPDFWCSDRDQLRFGAFGDPPPPLMLAGPGTFDSISTSFWSPTWVVAPEPEHLRRDQAGDAIEQLEALLDREWELRRLPESDKPPVALSTSLRRADQVADFVGLTIAPLRYAAVLVALALVIGAASMVARAERRELRLRAVRGVGPAGLAFGQLRWLAPITLGGATAGAAFGWWAVRALGPSPDVEPAALRTGLASGVIGWLVGAGVAAAAIAAIGAATVDRRRRRVVDLRSVLEVGVVALAVWSFVRLDRFGGVRQIGVEVRGGDLLAQAFPLLGSIVGVVLLSRPLLWLLRRARGAGRRLPVPLLLGVRRLTAEPAATTAVLLATSLAMAVAFQASALTTSVDRLLVDKAGMLVGADLSVAVLEPPPDASGLGSATTEIVRAKDDSRAYRLVGVDPASFASTVNWRSDAASADLDQLMEALAASPLRAIVVDPDHSVATGPFQISLRHSDVTLDVFAAATFFPGYSSGGPMFVVDRAVLGDRGDRSLLVRDPVAGVADTLAARGSRVVGTSTPGEVFGGTNFLSAKWSYATLTAFAVMLALVTLVGQVLVLESRLRARQVTRVLTRPMGMRRRQEVVAATVEVGLPLLAGVGIGVAIGWLVSGLALGRLDSLRTMQPPAELHVDLRAAGLGVVAAAIVTVGLALLGARRVERAPAAEVMRVAES
jgi:hypothetical protein